MSVNITVSGSTLKECQDQILCLADEIRTFTEDDLTTGLSKCVIPMTAGKTIPQEAVRQPVEHVAAPVASTPVPSYTGSSAVDSRGLPWDARIHSSNREQGITGVWRRRRGVSEELEAQVEAELRGQVPAKKAPPFGSMTEEQYSAVVQAAPPAPMPTTEHRVALPAGPDLLSQVQAVPPAPVSFAPPAPQQVLPPNTHNVDSFRNNLVTILNDLVVAGKINHDWINQQKMQFAGKDVTQWHENQAACANLFEAFVSWKLVNRL